MIKDSWWKACLISQVAQWTSKDSPRWLSMSKIKTLRKKCRREWEVQVGQVHQVRRKALQMELACGPTISWDHPLPTRRERMGRWVMDKMRPTTSIQIWGILWPTILAKMQAKMATNCWIKEEEQEQALALPQQAILAWWRARSFRDPRSKMLLQATTQHWWTPRWAWIRNISIACWAPTWCMDRTISHRPRPMPRGKATAMARTWDWIHLMAEEPSRRSSRRTLSFQGVAIKPRCKCIAPNNNSYLQLAQIIRAQVRQALPPKS